MKKLSRDEMKKVMGGNPPDDTKTYKCCIGTQCTACGQWVNCSAQATQTECTS